MYLYSIFRSYIIIASPVTPNRSMSGLLSGAWEAVDATDDHGTCRCIELQAVFAAQEQMATDLFNEDEVEDIVPLVVVDATQSLILSEAASRENASV